MTNNHKPNIHNNNKPSVFVFIVFYVILTFGCTAQKEFRSDTKDKAVFVDAGTVNINTATVEELEKIPLIGEKLAGRIVEYRETHGSFRKPEHLLLIQGISDTRFRQIRRLVRTE